jgi:hypothetical protein
VKHERVKEVDVSYDTGSFDECAVARGFAAVCDYLFPECAAFVWGCAFWVIVLPETVSLHFSILLRESYHMFRNMLNSIRTNDSTTS